MRGRVRLESDRSCSVHITTTWLDRMLGRTDEDYPAQRYTSVGNEHRWARADNRDVPDEVADAIERELTRACVGGRLKTLMRGGR